MAAANARSYVGGPPAPIFVSTNAGANWTQTSAPRNQWWGVASSTDGSKLVAVAAHYSVGDGLIYTSTNAGGTWRRTSAPINDWHSVASSADGTKLVATSLQSPGGTGLIYTSSDSGQT